MAIDSPVAIKALECGGMDVSRQEYKSYPAALEDPLHGN
jgi:hypothetical protein